MPEVPFILPYTAQSPTLLERLDYTTFDDLHYEISRILAEPQTVKFGIGQSLFYQVPLFADPNLLIPEWCWDMIEDYNLVKKFNVSLGNLDDISAWRTDCFNVIENEIENCHNHKVKKDGR